MLFAWHTLSHSYELYDVEVVQRQKNYLCILQCTDGDILRVGFVYFMLIISRDLIGVSHCFYSSSFHIFARCMHIFRYNVKFLK